MIKRYRDTPLAWNIETLKWFNPNTPEPEYRPDIPELTLEDIQEHNVVKTYYRLKKFIEEAAGPETNWLNKITTINAVVGNKIKKSEEAVEDLIIKYEKLETDWPEMEKAFIAWEKLTFNSIKMLRGKLG